jgi:hypothetical protein
MIGDRQSGLTEQRELFSPLEGHSGGHHGGPPQSRLSVGLFGLIGVSAALFLLTTVAIVVSVALSSGTNGLTLRDAALRGVSFAWAVPVVAVLCYAGWKILPALQDRETPDSIRVVGYERVEKSQSQKVEESEEAVRSSTPEPGARSLEPALPDWVTHPPSTIENGVEQVLLTSKQYATEDEAREELEQLAELKVKEYFHRDHPYKGHWTLPANFVDVQSNHSLFPKQFVEPIDRTVGTHSFRVQRVHALLSLSPQVREDLYPKWREQIVGRRLWSLGGIAGMLTLVVGSIAGYLRLDAATKGSYRRRLKLATVSLIVAGGLAAATFVTTG